NRQLAAPDQGGLLAYGQPVQPVVIAHAESSSLAEIAGARQPLLLVGNPETSPSGRCSTASSMLSPSGASALSRSAGPVFLALSQTRMVLIVPCFDHYPSVTSKHSIEGGLCSPV